MTIVESAGVRRRFASHCPAFCVLLCSFSTKVYCVSYPGLTIILAFFFFCFSLFLCFH
jgi:hypothetical protein